LKKLFPIDEEISMERKHHRLLGLFYSKERFLILLIALLLFFVLRPFLEGFARVTFLMNIFVSVILFCGLYAVSRKKSVFVIALLIALPIFGAEWMNNFVEMPYLSLLAKMLGALFYAYTSIIILTYIFREKEITPEPIYGAICVYFLMGLMWACIFFVLETLQPGSFQMDLGEAPSFSHFSYYSFVTLTTLGYGDITPLSHPARSLSTTEAITGQLYLAVMVAGLMGKYISQSRK
jgi:voltage-gated potassium channel